jgi:two-component system, NtrC family, response regulator HydG
MRVLVVDDDAGLRYTLREILEAEGFDVEDASDGEQALRVFDAKPFPLVVTDWRMPKLDGKGLLAALLTRSPPPKVVLITAHGSERNAVDAMKAGAWDYFRKPFDNEELLAVVRRASEAVQLKSENERLQGSLALAGSWLFASPSMARLSTLIARVAPRDVTVLVSGESGTGKERVCEALWRASSRSAKPFLRFNCASLTAELAEAELFGHLRGSFTGATRDRPGLFGEADGGTLLLDEVGELAPGPQAKLLRVLQDGEVRAVGQDRARKVDVRVLAATHKDLQEQVTQGHFREDLFYRLNVVSLRVPPLRERPEDIPVLARAFLLRFQQRFGLPQVALSDAALARLTVHPWPGNVRELENALERLVALSPEGELDLSLLPGPDSAGAEPATPLSLKERVESYERGLILEALRHSKGNRSQAARDLGMSRVTLHDKLKKYGLGAGEEDPGS